MNLQKFFLVVVLAVLLFQGCNKEQNDFSNGPDPSTESALALRKLKTEKEINFFDFNYLPSANPYLLPTVSGRDGEEDSLINSVYDHILLLNDASHFVDDLVDEFGYPEWTQSEVFPDTSNNETKVLITPLAKTDEDHISCYFVAYPHETEDWFVLLIARETLDSMIQTDSDYPGLGFHVITVLNLDEKLFGTEDETFENWVEEHEIEDGDGNFTGGLSSRNGQIIICPSTSRFPISSRRCETHNIICIGTETNTGTGTGIGSPIGGGGGISVPGGGGSSGTGTVLTPAQQEIAQMKILCQQIQNQQNEPTANPISFTPAEASFCQKFNILEQNPQVSEAVLFELAHKFNTTGVSPINEVLAYVNSHAATSTVNAGIVKWNKLGGKNGTGLFLGQFLDLYVFISTQLSSTLTTSQFDYLVTHTDVGVAANFFYDDNGGTADVKDFISYVVDILSQNLGVTFQEFMEAWEWKKILENPDNVVEEAEINNGIGIVESSVPSSPPSGTHIGSNIARVGDGDPDLTFGTNANTALIRQDMVALDNDDLFVEMTDLFEATSIGVLETAAMQFIDEFRDNTTVRDYHNPTVSNKVRTSNVMKNFVKRFGEAFNTALGDNVGNLNNINVELGDDRPQFNTPWHKLTGLQILINDTEYTTVKVLDDFSIDLDTGEWEGTFFFEVNDNFGLDLEDVLKFQFIPLVIPTPTGPQVIVFGEGFAAWWLLQHDRGNAPLRTKIWINYKLKGKI